MVRLARGSRLRASIVAVGVVVAAITPACSGLLGLSSLGYVDDASPGDGRVAEAASPPDGAPETRDAAPTCSPAPGDASRSCCDTYYDAVMLDQPAAYFRLADLPGSTSYCANAIAGSTYKCLFSSAGLTYGVAGECTQAVRLGTNGSVKIQNSMDALDFQGNTAFTIEAWIEVDAVGGALPTNDPLASAMLFETGPFAGYQLTLTGGDGVGAPGPREEMWIGGVLSLYAQNTSDPAPSVPFHLALVHNPTDGLDHLYVNGADSNDGFGGPDAGSARPATGKPLVWQGFLGTLGEVAVYETALTDTQIANHYRAGQ